MNQRQPISKAKLIAVIGIVCGGCALLVSLVIVLVSYLDREGIIAFRKGPTQYYHPADLKVMNLPKWNGTNTIPLSPDKAILAAMRYASSKNPSVSSWDVDGVEIRNNASSDWVYTITLMDRQSGAYKFEVIRVLMDGSVWEPTAEKR